METHLQSLCQSLKENADVSVLVANNSRQTVDEIVDNIQVARLGRLFEMASTSICLGMISRIKAAGAQIVHIHVPNPAATLAYLASGHSGKLVITYHSDVVRQKVLNGLFEPILQMLLRRADAILVASPNYLATSQSLRNHKHRCHVVPLGVPQSCFEPAAPREVAARRKQHAKPLILSVGRLVYYKGFEYLIRAMRSVPGHLLLIGKGPLKTALVELAIRLGVRNRVTFVSELAPEALHAAYHAADLFVLPSICRSEAFGMVQVEAMAAGLPVVNTNLPSGVPFVSPHGVSGLTVPPADSEALAEAINCLLNAPSLRSEYGRAGRERALKEFSSQTMTKRTIDVYRTILRAS
ncbi:MAG: glycosyltransferase [Bryobacteraceae bacterium]